MKYVIVLSSLDLGGAERQALNFAVFLKNKGIKIDIIGLTKPGIVSDICKEKDIRCFSICSGNYIYSKVLRYLTKFKLIHLTEEQVNLFPLVRKLSKIMKKNDYEACVSYCSYANTIMGNVKKKYSKAIYIWFQRDAGIFDQVEGMQKVALDSVDFILANSISGKKWLKTIYKKDSVVIENGVELNSPLESKEVWRKRITKSDSDVVCTMIANLSSAKDHMSLLKVWEFLIKSNRPYKLVFAGRFDDEYHNLKKYVEEHNLSDFVLFLGPVKDISGLISATDICVFGAISEGCPNGIIEQAMNGIPVVATDLEEIREVVSEENYSFLFQKGDFEQAAFNIQTLANDMSVYERVGQANRHLALEKFDQQRNFTKIINLINGDDNEKHTFFDI